MTTWKRSISRSCLIRGAHFANLESLGFQVRHDHYEQFNLLQLREFRNLTKLSIRGLAAPYRLAASTRLATPSLEWARMIVPLLWLALLARTHLSQVPRASLRIPLNSLPSACMLSLLFSPSKSNKTVGQVPYFLFTKHRRYKALRVYWNKLPPNLSCFIDRLHWSIVSFRVFAIFCCTPGTAYSSYSARTWRDVVWSRSVD